MDGKKRLIVDMDGTLAEFKKVDTLEQLYEKNYFLNLSPHINVIEAVKEIISKNDDIEVYICSSVLSDSKYALKEKNAWLDKYLPEIPKDRRIFPPCGEDKKKYIPNGVSENDFLLDDYTNVLRMWNPPGRGIKLMNGINGTNGTWKSDKISMDKSSSELRLNIEDIVFNRKHYYDNGPVRQEDSWKLEDVSLTNDGYACFDLLVTDFAFGKAAESKVSGLFRVDDKSNGAPMKIVKIDTYGVSHAVLKNEWHEIEQAVYKGVLKAQANKGLSRILDQAQKEIEHSNDVWGYWSGRIVNENKINEYIEMEIEGISSRNELRLFLYSVEENEITDAKEISFVLNPKSVEDIETVFYDMYLVSENFVFEKMKTFDVAHGKEICTYLSHEQKKHLEKLVSLGYEEYPSKEKYFASVKSIRAESEINEAEAEDVNINFSHISRRR